MIAQQAYHMYRSIDLSHLLMQIEPKAAATKAMIAQQPGLGGGGGDNLPLGGASRIGGGGGGGGGNNTAWLEAMQACPSTEIGMAHLAAARLQQQAPGGDSSLGGGAATLFRPFGCDTSNGGSGALLLAPGSGTASGTTPADSGTKVAAAADAAAASRTASTAAGTASDSGCLHRPLAAADWRRM